MKHLALWAGPLEPGESVELVQARKSGGIAVIATLEGWTTPDELTARAMALAQSDADAMGGRMRYYLRAGERRSKAFHREGAEEVERVAQVDLRDLNASLFKFLQQLSGQVITLTKRTAEGDQETIKQLRKRVENADKLHLKTVELVESLMNAQHERDLATKREERKEKIIEKGGAQLLQFMPSVFRKFLGKGAAKPDPESLPAFQQLKAIVDNLKPNELLAIQAAIPDKAAAIFDVFKDFAPEDPDEDENDEGDDERAPEDKPNGKAGINVIY